MDRKSCVDCEERDAVWIDSYGDELCSTCYTKRIKNKGDDDADMQMV